MYLARLLRCVALVAMSLVSPVLGQSPRIADLAADSLPEGALLRMGSTRLTHASWLTCVRFSPDDRWLATADSNGGVRLWETATGRLAWARPERTGRNFAFSPDGKTLAIGGYYNPTITLWDLEHDREIRELRQNARVLEYSRNGELLAAAGKDKIVRLWNPRSGEMVKEFKAHQSELYAVALSPDGRWLASGGGDSGTSRHNEIRIWDVATGQEVAQLVDDNQRLKQLPDTIYSLKFSCDGKTLGAAGPYVVRLWDMTQRKLAHRLTDSSHDIAFSPIDRRLVLPGDFGIFDADRGEQLTKLDGKVGVYGCVAFSHDGRLIASGNMDGQVQLWNAATGRELVRRSGHEGGIRSVALSPDGTLAATVSRQDGTIRLWGTTSGNQLARIPVTWRGPDVWWNEEGSDVLFAPYGREILTWTYDGMVRYWQPGSLQARTLQLGDSTSTGMAFSRDGTLAAVVQYGESSRYKIAVHELDGGAQVASLDPFDGKSSSDTWISALAFSPDAKMLAVGVLKSSLQDAPAPSVQLWDIGQQRIERRLRPAIAPPGKICFSPDGKLLATSAVRATPVQLWRVSDGVEVANYKVEADAHGRDPAPLAFSPDSKRFAAADVNREIYVWELATGAKIRTLAGHQKAVTSIVFSPDGKTLLSGSEDATAVVWDLGGGAPPSPVTLTPQQLSDYWDALAESDSLVATSAARVLLGAPRQTLELFYLRLTPGEAHDPAELPRLIADLVGDNVKSHLQAGSRLAALGSQASPALFKALSTQQSAAARRRIEEVLQRIGEFPIPPESLQRTRAIALVEQIGTDEARKLLAKLADTQPPTTASRDAQAALRRLQQRLRAPSSAAPPSAGNP